jgi:hypothetical protein
MNRSRAEYIQGITGIDPRTNGGNTPLKGILSQARVIPGRHGSIELYSFTYPTRVWTFVGYEALRFTIGKPDLESLPNNTDVEELGCGTYVSYAETPLLVPLEDSHKPTDWPAEERDLKRILIHRSAATSNDLLDPGMQAAIAAGVPVDDAYRIGFIARERGELLLAPSPHWATVR